jgi:mono/diheme cytochrome c family protein
MKIFSAILAALLALGAAAGLYAWSGAYDVGADVPHWRATERFLAFARERAIARHAAGIAAPALDDEARIRRGAQHYAQMCASCHLTPGMRDTELRKGLYPLPPDLARQGVADPAAAFWTVKHGVKLTAMAAWGRSHDDAAIWDMVAFLRRLPALDEAGFEALAGSAGNDGHGGMDGHHHHVGMDMHGGGEGHADGGGQP